MSDKRVLPLAVAGGCVTIIAACAAALIFTVGREPARCAPQPGRCVWDGQGVYCVMPKGSQG